MPDQEYFTVHHNLTVNVEPLPSEESLPPFDQFESEIPAPFLVASEFSNLDLMNDNARNELKSKDLKHVIALLDTQNAKLNLLLTFLLAQQDVDTFRYQTTSFGASQFSYLASTSLAIEQKVRVKLFLDHPAAAIYSYGHVVHCEQQDGQCLITIKYDLLRDLDEDLLIKAALYQQQKILRQRTLNRDK